MEPMGRRSEPGSELLDEAMPEGLEWRRLVRDYPLAALGLAAVGGYVLGRNRGPQILEALSRFAADRLAEQVNEVLGEEVI